MVDASDKERLNETKKELNSLFEMPELLDIPFVIFGNKIDKKGALTEHEFRHHFDLSKESTYGKSLSTKNHDSRKVGVFMCSVKERVGYSDGFEWLSAFLQ